MTFMTRTPLGPLVSPHRVALSIMLDNGAELQWDVEDWGQC